MTNESNFESAYFLSRFRPYEFRQEAAASQKQPVRRFSYVDNVLDEEYKDYTGAEPVAIGEKNHSMAWHNRLVAMGARLTFRCLLKVRLVTYYALHIRYRAF